MTENSFEQMTSNFLKTGFTGRQRARASLLAEKKKYFIKIIIKLASRTKYVYKCRRSHTENSINVVTRDLRERIF